MAIACTNKRMGSSPSTDEIANAVREVMCQLHNVIGKNRRTITERVRELFSIQFEKLIKGGGVEWQFRPSIERQHKKFVDAAWLFDLIWYSVVRDEKLCMLHDVALILESELSPSIDNAQHDFLKLLYFRSDVKVAILGCRVRDCVKLIKSALTNCMLITKGRYMIWRMSGDGIELIAEFDIIDCKQKKCLKIVAGLMNDVTEEECGMEVLKL